MVMILWGKTYASRSEEKRLPRGERSFSKLLITFGIRALRFVFWDLRFEDFFGLSSLFDPGA